jgi:PAS domain S-box-containing protein
MGRGRAELSRAGARYAFVVVLIAAVTVCALRWSRYWSERGPLLAFVLAIVVASLVGGARLALLATGLSGVAMDRFFMPRSGSLLTRPTDLTILVVLTVLGGVVVAVAAVRDRQAAYRHALGEDHRRRAEATEQALHASEARMRRLRESNIIGVAYSNAAGAILEANDFVIKMLGSSRAEVAAGRLRWSEITPPEDLARDARGIAEALERGACTPYEKEYVTRDGRRVPTLVGYALLDRAREEFICFVLDLTDQKRAEAELARQVTRTITDHVSAALLMLDENGFCTFMNPAAEAMFGWRIEELGRLRLHDAIHHHRPDGRPYPRSECDVRQALVSGGAQACEDIYFRRSGEMFPAQVSVSRIERAGQPPCLLLEMRDVTEQARAAAEREMLLSGERAARAEAERASHAKDEFVATVSHELRTPLNAILGFAHLGRRPGQRPEQVGRALDVIERNATLLTQIISDLLDVSRIVTGKLSLTLAPVELGPLIEAALTAVAAAAEAKGVALHVDLGAPSAFVRGDAPRLHQVVWNLVTNAIKFTPRGGRVDVSLAARDGALEIVVSDTGQGMDPAFVPHLFERFRQADGSASRSHGGLGLGLSIVKHIVELHGGEVRAASEGLCRGSRFTVVLPERPGLTAEIATLEPCRDPSELVGARVLVVDDEPDAKEIVRRLLEEQGARVVTASSAREALVALAAGLPDVMVSDIGMPEMDGYDLIRLVRSGSAARDVPAVALTAYARPEDCARVLRAGYQAHLSKPVVPSELLTTVARLAHHGAAPAT